MDIVALVRAEDDARATARVRAALERAATSLDQSFDWGDWQHRVQAIAGDLAQEHCGASRAQIEGLRLACVKHFWHFGASLNFEGRSRDEIFATNVRGTKNALALAQAVGVQRFVYISTAYTSGKRVGWVPEKLHPLEGPFHNYYEESKCRAEHEVVAFARGNGIDCRIVRPSIVLGPSKTHGSGGSRTGIYRFMEEIYKARDFLARLDEPLIIAGDPQAPLNLIPVDQVVEDLIWLIDNDFPNGPIYHSTSTNDVAVGEGLTRLCKYLPGVSLRIAERPHRPRTRLERLISLKTSFSRSYFRSHRQFARSLPGGRRVSLQDLEDYFRTFLQELEEQV